MDEEILLVGNAGRLHPWCYLYCQNDNQRWVGSPWGLGAVPPITLNLSGAGGLGALPPIHSRFPKNRPVGPSFAAGNLSLLLSSVERRRSTAGTRMSPKTVKIAQIGQFYGSGRPILSRASNRLDELEKLRFSECFGTSMSAFANQNL